ncbi:MAG: arginine--tRNA ligase [Opitutae bacterium]|nr:arginine--tRNA ligase [Rhodospirillaceae bacterium]MBL61858.1 arginine--tRNA ligase [Opitutae bacterium]
MIHRSIQNALQVAVAAELPDADTSRVLVRPCDPKFGDYQSNALMALAKQRRMNPRELAGAVVARLDVSEWCSKVEIAGPGFLNFHLEPEAVSGVLKEAASSDQLFFEPAIPSRTIVIDFSSPNVAKPMHVGHIRSTILGDSLARILRLLGHRVVTDNHIGDWGTQFGMLLLGWKTILDEEALEADPIAEMERIYKAINSDESLRDAARAELLKLQSGDSENLSLWQQMIDLSQQQFDMVYGRLGVGFDYTLGESFYNDELAGVVEDLRKNKIAVESEGAMIVEFPDDSPLKGQPAIVRKSDGAANYTTTDLATLQHRQREWLPDEILYVTDGRQQLHFQQLFAIHRRWRPEVSASLEHVWFGSILGPDRKPFKTRSGEVVKLAALLDEAEERAFTVVTEKNPDLDGAARREIARIVGLGALKYADLSNNRQSDYIFDWDRMLALQGNTAPYLQYAYTRIRSIFRKAGMDEVSAGEISLSTPEEFALAKHLLNFGLALEQVAAEYRPNYLCTYLYELAGHYARFYEACPVLQSGDAQTSRLTLCDLAARVLKEGLGVLGIEVTDKM